MRIAWFTPVSEASPVADFSRRVVPELARCCDVEVFCDRPPQSFPDTVPVTQFSAALEQPLKLTSYDALFFNLGNSCEDHARIFDIARCVPGIVVLHDRTLHPFFLDYYLRDLRRPDLYLARMWEHYGAAGLLSARRVVGPRFYGAVPEHPEFVDPLRFTFMEEALRRAIGTVVHSRWQAGQLSEHWSGRIWETWLPAPGGSALAAPRAERAGMQVALMTLSDGRDREHIRAVISALADDPRLAGSVRYLVVAGSETARRRLRVAEDLVAATGLRDVVQVVGPMSSHELGRTAAGADVFINLRHPNFEGCSSALMYQLWLGKPVLVYDVDFFSEVPDDAVAKVGLGDPAALRRRLRQLVYGRVQADTIGAAAARFAASQGTFAYAQQMLEFNDQLAAGAISDRIATHIGEVLASLSVTGDSHSVPRVAAEATSLLEPPVEVIYRAHEQVDVLTRAADYFAATRRGLVGE